jgi:hypothetical protein
VARVAVQTNDAAKNDATGIIPEPVLQGLREMGAYGLQVGSTGGAQHPACHSLPLLPAMRRCPSRSAAWA